jgi:hypothetical protein
MAAHRLKKLLSEVLIISIPELARKANVNEKSVRNLFVGKHKSRERTRRDVLDAINKELAKKRRDEVGPEIFD